MLLHGHKVVGYLLAEVPFVRKITEDPVRFGSTQAPGSINKEQIVVILTLLLSITKTLSVVALNPTL